MSIERTTHIDNERTIRVPEPWWYDPEWNEEGKISLDGVKHESGQLNGWDYSRWRQYDENDFQPELGDGYIGRGVASIIFDTLAVSPEVITKPDTIAAAICRSNVLEISDSLGSFLYQLFPSEHISKEQAEVILLGTARTVGVGAWPEDSIMWRYVLPQAIAAQVRSDWIPIIAEKIIKMETDEYQGIDS